MRGRHTYGILKTLDIEETIEKARKSVKRMAEIGR